MWQIKANFCHFFSYNVLNRSKKIFKSLKNIIIMILMVFWPHLGYSQIPLGVTRVEGQFICNMIKGWKYFDPGGVYKIYSLVHGKFWNLLWLSGELSHNYFKLILPIISKISILRINIYLFPIYFCSILILRKYTKIYISSKY